MRHKALLVVALLLVVLLEVESRRREKKVDDQTGDDRGSKRSQRKDERRLRSMWKAKRMNAEVMQHKLANSGVVQCVMFFSIRGCEECNDFAVEFREMRKTLSKTGVDVFSFQVDSEKGGNNEYAEQRQHLALENLPHFRCYTKMGDKTGVEVPVKRKSQNEILSSVLELLSDNERDSADKRGAYLKDGIDLSKPKRQQAPRGEL